MLDAEPSVPKPTAKPIAEQKPITTGIDLVYNLIISRKKTKISEIAKELKLDVSKVREWIEILEESGFVKTRYPLVGEMEVLKND